MLSKLPKEINALISTFLENEGNLFREHASNFIIKEVRNGNTYGNGLLHSFEDKPAVINVTGCQMWYQNGKLHREGDKPAIIKINGTQEWYQNGKLHRDRDKPALIIFNGSQEWYQNGKLHRDVFNKFGDQPAVIWMDGTRRWYQNGEMYSEIWANNMQNCIIRYYYVVNFDIFNKVGYNPVYNYDNEK